MAAIKVLLAEDHDIVREGTRQLLERSQELLVVGEAADGEEAVRLVEQMQPDVVVMDVRMPRMTGLEATRLIKSAHPDVRVLILSAYEDDQYVFPLLDAGADGYLLKTTNGRDLIRAVEAVHAGRKVLDPNVTGKVVGQLMDRREHHPGDARVEELTERELEVLRALASGKSNKQMAADLAVSISTVQVHLRNIFGKLGVSSRTEAVTYALRHGWISLNHER